ncbi:MAG: acetylxylan esterase [Victivallaceae bacterium]|nr:acetylxylan esterase [Victivallaceae bacterium]
MKEYEITFTSSNDKRITAYVVEPDPSDVAPGLIHIAHGWGGNIFSTIPREAQKEFAARYNLISVATEYRQSGYDSNGLTGFGSELPYDFSYRQTIDCLNAIRTILRRHPIIDKSRIIAWGASHGGHISNHASILAASKRGETGGVRLRAFKVFA